MAKEDAALDNNNRASMLVADPVTGEARRLKASPSGAGLAVGLGEALSAAIDSIAANEAAFTYVKLTASGVAFNGSCSFAGFVVLSSTSGVVTVFDNTAASGETPSGYNAVSVVANDQKFLPKPVRHNTGVYVNITGTATVYALVRAN